MENEQKAILRTILYADIFDYTLSFEQLWYFLLSSRKMSKKDVLSSLSNLGQHIVEYNGCYALNIKRKLFAQSLQKKSESLGKIEIAKKIAKILSFVPTVKYIGISGSLAMKNAKAGDDIDFFLIVSKDTIWLSRICCLIILTFLGKRRTRNAKQIKDTICLNMILDTNALSLPLPRRTIYTAHEIMQLKTLYSKNQTYEKFLMANTWIKKILPNAMKNFRASTSRENIVIWWLPLEFLAKKMQSFFINRHRTTETVNNHFLAFHPFDYSVWVEKEYKKRLKIYEIV